MLINIVLWILAISNLFLWIMISIIRNSVVSITEENRLDSEKILNNITKLEDEIRNIKNELFVDIPKRCNDGIIIGNKFYKYIEIMSVPMNIVVNELAKKADIEYIDKTSTKFSLKFN